MNISTALLAKKTILVLKGIKEYIFAKQLLTLIFRCGVPYSCCHGHDGNLVNLMCGFEVQELKDPIEVHIRYATLDIFLVTA